jgi:hypothetical protein
MRGARVVLGLIREVAKTTSIQDGGQSRQPHAGPSNGWEAWQMGLQKACVGWAMGWTVLVFVQVASTAVIAAVLE